MKFFIILTSLFVITSFFIPNISEAQYTLLEPVDILYEGKDVVKYDGLSDFLNSWLRVGITIAGIAAVFMIIWGGVTYMTTDAAGQKSEGKSKIVAAIGGLILALTSWAILNTINPQLLNSDIQFNKKLGVQDIQGDSLDTFIRDNNNEAFALYRTSEYLQKTMSPEDFDKLSDEKKEDFLVRGGVLLKTPDAVTLDSDAEDRRERIAQAAELYVENEVSSCNAKGTDGGNLACVWAVNNITRTATGEPINHSLSTTETFRTFLEDDRYEEVLGGLAASKRGDYVISPTTDGVTGHIGIVTEDGGVRIVSNSSSSARIEENYTLEGWQKRFATEKGLAVYIFRLK